MWEEVTHELIPRGVGSFSSSTATRNHEAARHRGYVALMWTNRVFLWDGWSGQELCGRHSALMTRDIFAIGKVDGSGKTS